MKKFFPILVSVFLCGADLFAQHTVSGVVVDAETFEPLPSATILIQDTFRGTIANTQGEFELEVSEFPVTLVIRFIGFETKRIIVEQSDFENLEIPLSPSVYELGEITVTDRDPGLTIMERVIENKKIWRRDLKSYEVEAFTRQILENDTSIVSITESGTISYWDSELGHREVQLYKDQTSNIAADQNLTGVRYLPNLYNDNIEIAGFNLVGITHPDALRYYDFTLLETLTMDGKPVYKIGVTPSRRLQPAFEGTAFVLGEEYALLEVDLKPNSVVNFPPPVQEFDLSYRQQFSNYGGHFWLPVDIRIEGVVRISMVGLRFPPIKFRQVSRLTDYKVNEALPDSLYRQSRVLVTPTLSERDSLRSGRFSRIPLTDDEADAYSTIDSTHTIEDAFQPEGFLARMMERGEEGGRESSIGNIIPSQLGLRAGFNRMNGYKLGLSFEQDIEAIRSSNSVYLVRNFYSEDWDYGINTSNRVFNFNSRSGLNLVGSYHNKTSQRYSSRYYTSFVNSLGAVSGGADYFDYYKSERFYAGLTFRRVLPRTSISIGYQNERHNSIESGSEWDYSLFGWHSIRRENPSITPGQLNSLKAEIGYNVGEQNYGIAGSRSFKFEIEHTDSSLGSDFSFTSLSFDLDWNWETFYQRRLFANTLDMHLSGGYSFGILPPQRFGTIDGSLNRFGPFGALKTRINAPYEGSKYWLWTAEHNFRTIPFELIGLYALSERGWGVILFGGAGYSKVENDTLQFIPLTTSGVHSEIGVSLNSIFGILRLDFAKRVDSPGTYFGFSVPRYF